MSLKSTIISSFAKIVLGSSLFYRIKATVLRVDGDDIPGSEKRDAVVNELRIIGISAASYLINLGIELAVAYLRTLAEKQK
jgi:hypothetical protein